MSVIQTKPNKNLMDNNTMIRKLAKDEIKCNQYTFLGARAPLYLTRVID